jgi:3-phenylpropionate/trans-cinnamate dioxygenase ferredoxin reductase subunit
MTDNVVVVGGGLGGLRTAESLRASGYAAAITVVGEEPHLPYNRPPLSKEALANGVNVEELHFRRRPSVDDVQWQLGSAIVASDLSQQTLTSADGTKIPFTGLVIATGIRPRELPIPGPSEGLFFLRTAEDAHQLRIHLGQGKRLVIIGSGFIGCEVASTARSMGCEVDIVSLDSQPMIRPLGEDLGSAMRAHHQARGVRFHLGRTVTEFLGREAIAGVRLDDGTAINADLVLEAIGSSPNTEWLTDNGLDLSNGVLTDEYLRVAGTDVPAVAVGDVARHPNALFPGSTYRIEHWNMPTEMGKRAGATLAALMRGDQPEGEPFRGLPSFWSDQYDLALQSFGLPGSAQRYELVEGDYRGDCIVAYYDDSGLVGVVGVNKTPELMPFRKELMARRQ